MSTDQAVQRPLAKPSFVRPAPEQQSVLKLGRIVATPGALEAVALARISECLLAHARGDWGCVGEQDRRTNDEALKRGFRILSAYPIDPSQPSLGHGENTLWIITEWDRSLTTVLLPQEY
jgi:hypothetical protein